MIAIFLFLLLLGFIWVAVPQDNKRVADIQYKIVIVGLGLILLLGVYFTVAIYKGWIVLGLLTLYIHTTNKLNGLEASS